MAIKPYSEYPEGWDQEGSENYDEVAGLFHGDYPNRWIRIEEVVPYDKKIEDLTEEECEKRIKFHCYRDGRHIAITTFDEYMHEEGVKAKIPWVNESIKRVNNLVKIVNALVPRKEVNAKTKLLLLGKIQKIAFKEMDYPE